MSEARENLAQNIFDDMSSKYPNLEQTHLAKVISHTMKRTYNEGREYFAEKLVEYLNDMWMVISVQKVPQSLVTAIKADPEEAFRMATAMVASRTVETIAQIATVTMSEIDKDDPEDNEIGNPKGMC